MVKMLRVEGLSLGLRALYREVWLPKMAGYI